MRRSTLVPALVLPLALCGSCSDSGGTEFEAELESVLYLAATDSALPGDIVNPHLGSGWRSPIHRYRVPAYACVREGGTDWTTLPEAARVPGTYSYFDVVLPAGGAPEGNRPILMHLHGSGLEFMEAIALTALRRFPAIAAQFGIVQGASLMDVEQTTQDWSRQTLASSEAQPFLAVALERGYTVIFPANCWGDGGHGEGETVDGFYTAPRYGALLDAGAWAWARENLAHEGEIAFSCSGGGHRTAEMMIRDPAVFDAVVVDSPADYLPGLLEAPQPTLLAVASQVLAKEYDQLVTDFFGGFFGGIEEAGRWALGTRIGEARIEVPIYLAYSEKDPLVTPPISGPLVRALSDPSRYPVERGRLWNNPETLHCQLNTRERSADGLDWLERSAELSR
ncbi:MAG: hypothetical protein HYY13_10490 [Nitrospirae bacterium]|nr:hypothetical protein [Nitrospirota bacterium]